MEHESIILKLQEKYKLNMMKDILFADSRQVFFVCDLNELPKKCYIINGNLEQIGLPHFEEIEAKNLLNFVEPNNLLADVEGKYNFIESIKNQFNTFYDELFLYIPVKRNPEPLWLYVGLRRNKTYNLVLGHVFRVYESTPIDIIHYQKTYQDSLTRLFSRETLKKHMSYLSNTERSYFLYLDIDGFKRINDQYGHQAGDKFLVDIADFFIQNWEYNVLYYRLGGDEFAMYCYDHSEEDIINRAKKLIESIENLNEISKALGISVSIGIVKITPTNKDYHMLLNLGDDAMYKSKIKGIGNYTLSK
ncbi:Diguanylate cyclase DosC [Acholeplasma oculi]|uniref:GGDEF domain-containing protein n=1 Tax=Acholeplasma oculi TaxID=35623 RepID=A0A061A9S6_9MOLU|nr:GGDEF domain-containing protein [Acholeplasma oculi]CDR30623.1 GGDEF domain-containing protein [Acholeplasma oculi]SKC46232.1 diguanylate cyclase (GGDEF) domain-containing protein [Acholeplasma oculi]SUT89356.1 Diguanylate cyclase DosC [Acholeplasma oculi]